MVHRKNRFLTTLIGKQTSLIHLKTRSRLQWKKWLEQLSNCSPCFLQSIPHTGGWINFWKCKFYHIYLCYKLSIPSIAPWHNLPSLCSSSLTPQPHLSLATPLQLSWSVVMNTFHFLKCPWSLTHAFACAELSIQHTQLKPHHPCSLFSPDNTQAPESLLWSSN